MATFQFWCGYPMPVVKIFTEKAPDAAALRTLGDALEKLCVEVLDANINAVQIVVVPVAVMLRGAGTLLEVHYRDREDRNADVLAGFMRQAEEACLMHFGHAPRIRCFALDQATLFARN